MFMRKNGFMVLLTAVVVFSGSTCVFAELSPEEQMYRPVLDLYAEGAENAWDAEAYQEHDLSYVFYSAPSDMGYFFRDINEDEVPELIVGLCTSGYNSDPGFGYCYDLYTFADGKPVCLGQGGERYRYAAAEDGTVSLYWSGGAANSGWDYFSLPAGADSLKQRLTIGTNYDEETNGIYWFKNIEEPFDKLDGEKIGQEEADVITGSFTYGKAVFTPITAYMENAAG